MKIAVYSGSFDPLHIGHQAIMEYLTGESGFDWVYLVVSPQNPFKGSEKLSTAERRYEDAVRAVRRHPELHVWVDDIEMKMPPPHYTIRTLDALKRREPQNDFTLVIGADNLSRIAYWKDSVRLLSEYPILVYPRVGFDSAAIREELLRDFSCNISLIDAPLVEVSSTAIREGLARGEDMSRWMM